MKYPIERLDSLLKDELTAQEDARKAIQDNNLTESDLNAFMESERLADERIPQLKRAITLLKYHNNE